MRIKDKPKKSRSLSLVGGSVREIHFKIRGDKIPTVRERPVKSLGRLYSIPLTDRHRGPEVQKVALKGLKSIDKTCLPGKMKAWCYQHGLLPRLLWSLQVYLQLPISSLVKEFKIGKVSLHMMLKDSADEIIRKACPEIKSVKVVQEADCSLRIKDIIGVTQTNRTGLGSTSKKVFSKVGPKGKRDMVSEEVRMFEEEQRKASAVT